MSEGLQVDRVTSSIGARVRGIDLASGVTDAQAEELKLALLEHLVVFLPNATNDEDEHMQLSRIFGEPIPHPVNKAITGEASLTARVRSDSYREGGNSSFHTDYSFCVETPDVSVLRAITMSSRGGDTIWANMYQAYETLSDDMKAYIERLDGYHAQSERFTELMIQWYGEEAGRKGAKQFAGATHPVVIKHPETNKKALFVNPGYTKSIVGLPPNESRSLLDFLFQHIHNPRFHCRYRWAVGDIAIWDERATVHMGEGMYGSEERELLRITMGSRRPEAARESERMLASA